LDGLRIVLKGPTTFVLGAGASFELKLPTGDGLQSRISELLQVSPDRRPRISNDRIWEALEPTLQQNNANWTVQAHALTTAAQKITMGLPSAASIDNFLHTHRNDKGIIQLGKLAITLAILEAESSSHISSTKYSPDPQRPPFLRKEYQSSWYFSFIRMLTMGTLSDDPHALLKNIKFVVFNYDRCLELTLLRAVQGYYTLDEANAANVLKSVEIIHPYGNIGTLPAFAKNGVAFGDVNADLLTISASLKTFTEAVDTTIVEKAKDAIATAETLVFMGFGFLPQNMDLLQPEDGISATRIHATTCGFSLPDRVVIAEQLRRFVKKSPDVDLVPLGQYRPGHGQGFVDIDNNTCAQLIDNHRMRLTQW
jgi:hypothetical protein